jgi:hypothetical protein
MNFFDHASQVFFEEKWGNGAVFIFQNTVGEVEIRHGK